MKSEYPDPVDAANNLKSRADDLLMQTDLIRRVGRFGEVLFTGSYAYDLMTWRDIDICLSVTAPAPKLAFEIGTELAEIDYVASMYYRNEYVLQTAGNPKGIFLCIEFLYESSIWKTDVLIATPKEIALVIEKSSWMKLPLDEDKRRVIIEIKAELTNTPDYRIKYRSTDIYKGVLKFGVNNICEWNQWWNSQTVK